MPNSTVRLLTALVALTALTAVSCQSVSGDGLVDPSRADAGDSRPGDLGPATDGSAGGDTIPAVDGPRDLGPVDSPMSAVDGPAAEGGADVGSGVDLMPDLPAPPVDLCAPVMACGVCGGTTRCDGSCSKPTPPGHSGINSSINELPAVTVAPVEVVESETAVGDAAWSDASGADDVLADAAWSDAAWSDVSVVD